ncbi:uncharacterized protein FYW23_013578 [Sylvia borin]
MAMAEGGFATLPTRLRLREAGAEALPTGTSRGAHLEAGGCGNAAPTPRARKEPLGASAPRAPALVSIHQSPGQGAELPEQPRAPRARHRPCQYLPWRKAAAHRRLLRPRGSRGRWRRRCLSGAEALLISSSPLRSPSFPHVPWLGLRLTPSEPQHFTCSVVKNFLGAFGAHPCADLADSRKNKPLDGAGQGDLLLLLLLQLLGNGPSSSSGKHQRQSSGELELWLSFSCRIWDQHRIKEQFELEETHKDHGAQLLVLHRTTPGPAHPVPEPLLQRFLVPGVSWARTGSWGGVIPQCRTGPGKTPLSGKNGKKKKNQGNTWGASLSPLPAGCCWGTTADPRCQGATSGGV